MKKNLKSGGDYILKDGIYLPSFLFLEKKQQENIVSPVSGFRPDGALEGSAFQSSVSPSQGFVPKKIFIDKDSFGFLLEEGERIAFLKRLQIAGFTIFFRGAEDERGVAPFYELKKDFSNIRQLQDGSQFNHSLDREEIKKLGIARDEILLLDAHDLTGQTIEIERVFCHNGFVSQTDGNNWNVVFLNDSANNVVPELPSYDDPKYFQKMVFVLNRSIDGGCDEIVTSLGDYFRSPHCKNPPLFDMEGFLTLLLSNRLFDELKEPISNKFRKTLEDFVFNNITSNKEFFAAIELFPKRYAALEGYLDKLSQLGVLFGVLYNYRKYPELIEKFPDKKDQLIRRIDHEAKVNPDLNLAQVSSILANILRGEEEVAIQKFCDLVEHLDALEDMGEEAVLKYKMTALFASAAHNNLRSDFFDKQLLQNISQAIDPNADRNSKISQYDFDEILRDLNSSNITKIAELALETNQDFLSEKLVIAATRANPQLSQQLLKAYCQKSDVSIESKKNVICSLPSRMVQNFLHGKVIESLDQFLSLEDLVGLRSTRHVAYKNPKHKTYLQSYDASKTVIEESQEWIHGDNIEGEVAKSIAAIKITNRDGEIDTDEVKSLIDLALLKTEVKHFSFSKDLNLTDEYLAALGERGATYEVNDYENYWGIGNLVRESAVRVKSEIRIAFSGLRDHIAVDNPHEKSSCNMGLAGEVLNGSSQNLRIRTAVIQDSDITQNLLQQEYQSQLFDSVPRFNILDAEVVEGLKKQASDEYIFCKFRQYLKANVKSRLLSVDAAEEFFGLVEDLSVLGEVSISKGDDGFFYAESTQDRNLSYVIKAPSPNISAAKSLAEEDLIRKIIDEYRDPEKGFSWSASYEKEDTRYDSSDHAGSMERMFNERLGSCRHRAAAVLYKIKSTLSQEDCSRCRMVGIDNNHVVLEVKYSDGEWIKADFGGSENYQLTTLDNSLIYGAEKLATPQLPVANKKKLKSSKPQQEQVAEQEEDSAAQLMIKALSSLTKFSKVVTKEDLTAAIASKSKSLIVASNLEDNANFLLSEAVNSGREVFYIDDPKKAELHKMNLRIGSEGIPFIALEGQLFDFLQRAKSADRPPLLLINWDVFDAKQRVAMNTILDQERMIFNVAIDGSIQIVGFASQYPKDASFIHRHDICVVSEISPKATEQEKKTSHIIDLEGFSNWRRKLFGEIILVGEEMVWQKSDFVLALESGERNFEIINLSPKHEQELQYELKQALATGKFSYHGYEIAAAEDLEVAGRGDNVFDFSKFRDASQVGVKEYSQMPRDATLINKHLFDLLICDKAIEGELYYEREGLIKRASEGEEKLLKLFISSELSDGQWYCLFNEAQKHGLKLKLLLNYGVELPSEVQTSKIQNRFENKETTTCIIFHDDAQEALKQVKADQPEIYAVVDVEDFTYQDLVEKLDFETTESGFKNFRKIESEIVERLRAGEKIVLKGKFSEGLFNSLAPLFFSELGRNLTVISEEVERDGNFEWLSPESFERFGTSAVEEKFSKVRLENFNASQDLRGSEGEAERFITERKSDLLNDLTQSNMLRLMGYSGVGKSSLLREFEKDDQETVKVYRELTSFQDWAQSKGGEGKIKILFIDESNMEDLHLTMFSPLKEGGKQRIFYKQKFYELDENHKVVFACNPLQFRGGRFEQKLFEDATIPVVELRDFPPSYIYERILKKTIYENLVPEIWSQIPESIFKERCAEFIEQYQQTNAGKKADEGNAETVRELQENVLRFIETSISRQPNPQINNADFVSTEATKEVEESLALSLRIRQKQYEGQFPYEACGLKGVLLNGDSGTGKSVLIKSVLESEGLEEIKSDAQVSAAGKRGYYKISASLPLKDKKKIITKAFEEGNVVWIDELNSCLEGGLEKLLNAVLTGEHPDGKKGGSGFMLVASVNSAVDLEGRSMISPALLHRMTWHDVKSLTDYAEADLAKIVKCWSPGDAVSNSAAQDIARDFVACLNYGADTGFNLRMLKKVLPSLVQNYEAGLPLENSGNVVIHEKEEVEIVASSILLGHEDEASVVVLKEIIPEKLPQSANVVEPIQDNPSTSPKVSRDTNSLDSGKGGKERRAKKNGGMVTSRSSSALEVGDATKLDPKGQGGCCTIS